MMRTLPHESHGSGMFRAFLFGTPGDEHTLISRKGEPFHI